MPLWTETACRFQPNPPAAFRRNRLSETPKFAADQRGRTRRTTEAKDSRRGIPQGSPLSPLLANLYMRRFVLGWKKLGLEKSLGTRLVTYADDLVIFFPRPMPS